jgi:AAA domain
LIVVWGPPKCGKTFWVFDLMMHAALGWEYRGRRVEAGTVVYIACEGERGLSARKEAFRLAKLPEDADPSFYLLTTRLDLPAQVDELILDIVAQIPANSCAAIVLDTLNRSIAGSESDDADMGAYVKAADKLREQFRCAIIIIHHCGIVDKRPRGHTSLTGAADAQIAVKRDASSQIIATVEFMKDGEEGEQTVSRLKVVEVGNDEDGEPITSCVIEPTNGTPRPAPSPEERRLTASQRRALDMLNEAIIKDGKIPAACDHIPADTPCVPEDLWRQYCYAGQIADSDKQEAKRQAFKRAAQQLLAARRIGKWNDDVWIIA